MAKSKKETERKLYKQSETVFIKRSDIHFAAYNPRKRDEKVVEKLRRNFRKVGFMGGIQWNAVTGNLIGGHKRTEALDLIHGYDGTPATDYEIKVERIELDEKTEKEQNIFLNNRRAQGEMDYRLLAEIIDDINPEDAALEEYDMNMIQALVPDFGTSNTGITQAIKERDAHAKAMETHEAEQPGGVDHVKNVKKLMKQNNMKQQESFYVVITFKNYMSKAEFLEGIGVNGDTVYITHEQLLKSLT